MKVKLQFNSQWAGIINEVARQCGLTVDTFCERAVMLTVREGIAITKEEENGVDNTTSTVIEGTDAEVRSVPDADSPALPEQADASSVPEGDPVSA
jgi:hypothetical protein